MPMPTKIRPGCRSGRLTAEYNTGRTEQRPPVWHCRCGCGGTSVTIPESVKRGLRTTNTTGTYRLKDGRYEAGITFKKRRCYLDRCREMGDAVRAREAAEEMHDDWLGGTRGDALLIDLIKPLEGAGLQERETVRPASSDPGIAGDGREYDRQGSATPEPQGASGNAPGPDRGK